ncbi:hypothetical protein SCHPADRAFT_329866 [Schizopora paradoxa]|uniref:Uncharacterized protein n=1 Tax=Schizopora paradoxa TaxID=27342 RepID=A0A0H2RQK5_9AGAM|nr:hypothetical protein SCHPADRAFT_329866 [Schizopora paradoxa]
MPPRQYLPTHELYAEQLLPLNLGYGLYEPDPGPGKEEIRIGDLGYILNGRFERIASVFTQGNGVENTVDEEFRAVNIYGDIDGRVLSSKSIRSVGVDGEASGGTSVPLGMSVRFSCEATSGASLIKKYRATDEKAAYPNVLKRHFEECVESVFEFATRRNHPITNLHNIILVTGRVMTGDWATIAFHNRSQDMNIAFQINAPVAGASFSLWGKWSEEITFPRKIGPRRQGATITDDEEPAFNQCIFIETYRMYTRPWYERLKSSLRISQKKGQAENTGGSKRGGGNASGSPISGPPSPQGSSERNSSEIGHQLVLTAYDALAVQAFYCSNSSFDSICIDEDDMKRTLPTSCTLSSMFDFVLDPSYAIDLDIISSYSSTKGKVVARLSHDNVFWNDLDSPGSVGDHENIPLSVNSRSARFADSLSKRTMALSLAGTEDVVVDVPIEKHSLSVDEGTFGLLPPPLNFVASPGAYEGNETTSRGTLSTSHSVVDPSKRTRRFSHHPEQSSAEGHGAISVKSPLPYNVKGDEQVRIISTAEYKQSKLVTKEPLPYAQHPELRELYLQHTDERGCRQENRLDSSPSSDLVSESAFRGNEECARWREHHH